MKRGLILSIFLAAVAFIATPAQANYTALYVFGDSLSDTGNIYAASSGQIPQPPYFEGRFSNGKVAVEYVAQGLGIPLLNQAYGGATSGIGNVDFVAGDPLYLTGVTSQVNLFVAALGGGGTDAQALYLIAGGSNDFLFGDLINDAAAIATAVIANLTANVATLYGAGARHFVLPLLPDSGLTPLVLAQGQTSSDLLSQLILDVNLELAGSFAALQALLPDADFTIFDTYAAQHKLLAGAPGNGLTNLDTACFTGDLGIPGVVCASPDSFFYWDSIHPTARVHALLGAQILAAVPESPTLLLSGLALLALVWRRSRPAAGMNGRAKQPG